MKEYREVRGCVHIHFPLSWGVGGLDILGEAASRAGLDFIIATSHTPRRKFRKRRFPLAAARAVKGTLVIPAEEIDDDARDSHCLALGVSRWAGRERPLDETLEGIRKAGGLTFIAHPDGIHYLFGMRNDHRWKRWDIEGTTGIEVWSLLFDWARRTRFWNLPVRYSRFPDNIEGPSVQNRRIWDAHAGRARTVGICGLDIHRVFCPELDVKRRFRYETSFGILRNHLLLPEFPGVVPKEPCMGVGPVLEAFRAGHLFFSNDRVGDSTGFFFGGTDRDFVMGDETVPGAEVEIAVPGRARVRLVKNGKESWTRELDRARWILKDPGVYRVEVYRGETPWIFSNHIYVRGQV